MIDEAALRQVIHGMSLKDYEAPALLEIEPKLRKIRGHQHFPALRQAMRAARQTNQTAEVQKAA